MGIRKRLFIQSVTVMVLTVVITIVSGLIYARIYEANTNLPVGENDYVAMVQGGAVIYKSNGISEFEVLEAMLEADMGSRRVTVGENEYFISVTEDGAKDFKVIKLEKILDFSGYYKGLLICIISVFTVVYLICSMALVYHNKKHITEPIMKLKEDASRLGNGELETVISSEGSGEIKELCEAVEQLRLKLAESVYCKERYDDNRKFLISGISHDLKTPVTAIRGYIEGVIDGVVDTKEKQEKYLKAALLKTDTIKNLIDDLLLYSKLDLNQIPFDLTTVNISDYLRDCVAESEYSFALEKKQLLICDITGEIKVNIDCERFRRVIVNILSNALKHTREGEGIVRVSLRENNSSVIIEIADNGKGIKKEDLPNIFSRFYRGEAARRSDGSSGLGLTIAKQIVEGLGGRIWATSVPGEGTSILISLKKISGGV